MDTLHHYATHSHKQDYGVEQRYEYRALAVAVGETLGGMGLRQPERHQGQQEAKYIAEVVARVGKQPHGIAGKPRHSLGGYKEQVDDYGHKICGAHLLHFGRAVMVMVVMGVAVMNMIFFVLHNLVYFCFQMQNYIVVHMRTILIFGDFTLSCIILCFSVFKCKITNFFAHLKSEGLLRRP